MRNRIKSFAKIKEGTKDREIGFKEKKWWSRVKKCRNSRVIGKETKLEGRNKIV